MLKNAVTLRQQLRDARFSEIDEIVLGGEGTSPIEAAKRIKTDVEMDGWIPGPLQPHVLCPLSNDEVFRLYASQGAISPEEEVQLSVQQPAVEKLVSPADFRLLVQEKDGASKRSQSHRKDLWDNRPGKERPSTDLQQLHQRVAATALFLGEPQNWLREVLFAGWTGGGHAQAWEDLIRVIDSLTVAAGDAQTLVMAYGPKPPNNVPPPDITTKLADIVRYLERGGVIGFKTRMTKPYGIGGRLIAYTLSGLTAAVSGVVLCSRLMSGQPGAGIGFELDAIAAVVLGGTAITGGRGHIFGTLIGAVTLGVLNNGLNLMEVSPYTQRVIKGAIIVLAIYTSTVKRRD